MSDAPQVVYEQQKETEPIEQHQLVVEQLTPHNSTFSYENETKAPRRSGIQGLALCIILTLSVLLVGTIVGAAVGGTLAVRAANRKHNDSKCTPNATQTTSPLPQNTTTSSQTAKTISLPSPASLELLDINCPPSGIVKSYDGTISFKCEDRTQLHGVRSQLWGPEIFQLLAYNFETCIEACIRFNEWGVPVNESCVGVHFHKDMATQYKDWRANCLLKTGSAEKRTGDANSTALSLCVDSECEELVNGR
ncbi:hypothetical protein CC78DRAFT_537293 [Lojkania enalia]|uniref:Apple domain-containing protein n=1 Tax=Lojkania enalia TaxID=147567 RepID=A0A9P4MVM8_9PLEO|nr:hypothetical protein CC78DRAFT_537293 [Didymosphaeria enalia]